MKTTIQQKISALKSLAKNNLPSSTTTSCSETTSIHVFKYIKTEQDAIIFNRELSLALQKIKE